MDSEGSGLHRPTKASLPKRRSLPSTPAVHRHHPLFDGWSHSVTREPMAEKFSRYREELLELLRNVPESGYELSLRDIVELRVDTSKEGHELSEGEKVVKWEGEEEEQKKKIEKSQVRKMGRNLRIDTSFLKTPVPTSLWRKNNFVGDAAQSKGSNGDSRWWWRRRGVFANDSRRRNCSGSSGGDFVNGGEARITRRSFDRRIVGAAFSARRRSVDGRINCDTIVDYSRRKSVDGRTSSTTIGYASCFMGIIESGRGVDGDRPDTIPPRSKNLGSCLRFFSNKMINH